MGNSLQQQIERVRQSLKMRPGEIAPRKEVIKVMAKKVKKVTKKVSAKKSGNGNRGVQATPEGMVSVAELAEEAGIGAQSARVKLRSAEIERPEGRWLWKAGSSSLKAARKALGLD